MLWSRQHFGIFTKKNTNQIPRHTRSSQFQRFEESACMACDRATHAAEAQRTEKQIAKQAASSQPVFLKLTAKNKERGENAAWLCVAFLSPKLHPPSHG
mmetsp:Transcript_5116/g.7227  ORF Transcript_5116/g.7227 Transcript_5116/m.7227 type:complete len:99 (-) Transcript_5116:2-298(-)